MEPSDGKEWHLGESQQCAAAWPAHKRLVDDRNYSLLQVASTVRKQKRSAFSYFCKMFCKYVAIYQLGCKDNTQTKLI